MFLWIANNEQATDDFWGILESQGVKIRAQLSPSAAIITYGGWWWLLYDNGGELNLEKLNIPDESVYGIPYTSTLFPMDSVTMAYRVLQALKGQGIDWTWHAPSDYSVVFEIPREGQKV